VALSSAAATLSGECRSQRLCPYHLFVLLWCL